MQLGVARAETLPRSRGGWVVRKDEGSDQLRCPSYFPPGKAGSEWPGIGGDQEDHSEAWDDPTGTLLGKESQRLNYQTLALSLVLSGARAQG